MSIKPVIVVVAYRRLHTLRRLLQSLDKARYSKNDVTLIISIDFHKNNNEVIKCAEDFVWKYGDKIVKTHSENMGLKRHIIECGDYSIEYGSVIILEDDQMVAPSFYDYVCLAQEYYQNDKRVAGVSMYAHEWNGYACKKFQPVYTDGDVYFGQFSCTRGQAWLAKQWSGFKEWYLENPELKEDELLPNMMYSWKKSWGKYFARYLVESGKYYVMPYKPVTTVFGENGANTYRRELDVQVALYWGKAVNNFVPFEKGVRYDIFFENVDLKKVLADRFLFDESEVSIDIYGLKNRVYNKRYVLSTKKMNYKIIESYDLNMRPHEINIFCDLRGDGIYLYDTSVVIKNKSYKKELRLEYDFAGIKGMDSFAYGWKHCWGIIKDYFKARK